MRGLFILTVLAFIALAPGACTDFNDAPQPHQYEQVAPPIGGTR